MTDTLTITRPDDWHLHFRDGDILNETVPATARVFGRAIVMPNLTPPVTTVALASAYHERIMAAVPAVPITMTGMARCASTDWTSPQDHGAP